jgi:hypothetical protein
MAKEATMNTNTLTIKEQLLIEADSTLNFKADRSSWGVCFAKKDIIHRGKVVLAAGEPALFDPSSRHGNNFDVYLAKNLGGISTTLKSFHFNFTK